MSYMRIIGQSVFTDCRIQDDVSDISSTTSMASSIMKYRQENGRTYHSYKDGSKGATFLICRFF